MRQVLRSSNFALVGAMFSVTSVLFAAGEAIAQATSPCSPPAPGEYILLVVSQTEQAQTQLRQTLPPNATTTVCQYLDNSVVRVGGFTTAENANSWAQYLNESGDFQAFVARPPATTVSPTAGQPSPTGQASTTAAAPPTAAATPTNRTAAYNPQPLGTGYAVVVNYFNRPNVATQVREFLARDVGLVSYNRDPYLLALYTTDPAIAASMLQSLGDRGFTAAIVDSRRVVLLTSNVVLAEEGR